jgi:hypothetical protein
MPQARAPSFFPTCYPHKGPLTSASRGKSAPRHDPARFFRHGHAHYMIQRETHITGWAHGGTPALSQANFLGGVGRVEPTQCSMGALCRSRPVVYEYLTVSGFDQTKWASSASKQTAVHLYCPGPQSYDSR